MEHTAKILADLEWLTRLNEEAKAVAERWNPEWGDYKAYANGQLNEGGEAA